MIRKVAHFNAFQDLLLRDLEAVLHALKDCKIISHSHFPNKYNDEIFTTIIYEIEETPDQANQT